VVELEHKPSEKITSGLCFTKEMIDHTASDNIGDAKRKFGNCLS
jgi:hypothetical protein